MRARRWAPKRYQDQPSGQEFSSQGDALFGRWGLTVVDGKLGAGGKAFGLRDVGTEQMIFEGELEGGTVTGVIGAESMLRRVHSLPARSLAEASFRLTHSEGPRLLTLEVQAGEVKRATFSTFGKNAKKDAPFTVRREPDRLVIVGEKVEWSLWPTASGVLGRSASGRLVSQDHTTSSDDPKPLPFTRGDVVTVAAFRDVALRLARKFQICRTVRGTPRRRRLPTVGSPFSRCWPP